MAARIRGEVARAVVGQDEPVELLLTALLAGGHVLLEGPPGTASEFADSIGAALMVETLSALLVRHLVVFVAFRDAELEGLAMAIPKTPADVSRAVVAGALLRARPRARAPQAARRRRAGRARRRGRPGPARPLPRP